MLIRIAFWLMLPVTAIQGLLLRRRAIRLPGAEGARQGSTGNGDGGDLHLLAIGDSIIEGVGTEHIEESLPVQFAAALAERSGHMVHWRIEGESGFDIEDVLDRLQSLTEPARADLVLISVGVNDVTGLSSTRHWRQKVEELLDKLNTRWPDARIVFAGLPPMSLFPLPPQPLRFSLGLRASALDSIAADVIIRYPNAAHVPTRINPLEHGFCEDGFHPSAKSCNLWASELAEIEVRSDRA